MDVSANARSKQKRKRKARNKHGNSQPRKSTNESFSSTKSSVYNNQPSQPLSWPPNPYGDIISWQHQHQIAYWKSKAVALSYENKVLHTIIADLYKNKGKSKHNVYGNLAPVEHRHQDVEEETVEENDEIVVSEEMLAFLQKGVEHRLLRDKEKKKKYKEEYSAAPPKIPAHVTRLSKMKALYGSKVETIMNLETVIKANVNQYIDAYNPRYWPNIPLNL